MVQDYERKCDQLAAGLVQEGVIKGDRLGIVSHNCDEFMILYGAAAKLGEKGGAGSNATEEIGVHWGFGCAIFGSTTSLVNRYSNSGGVGNLDEYL